MIEKKRFLGARIEPKILGFVDSVAEERNIDRTGAIKILVCAGWRELQLEKAIGLYRDGRISIDKAAKMAGITVSEMMQKAAMFGIKSEETMEEYRQGIKALMK